ncbi:MAG TPA: GNAT family N-acetyltransferase [Ilumatobacteraceae bacterium]|jgi:ribosomal protein S18 acetylase RimI-like enzyme|nr:GNAT family N-acetyltransferase [Ilumatobacteraceae bacterium]
MQIRVARPDDYDVIGDLTVDAYSAINPHAMRGDYDEELRDVSSRAKECVVLVAVDRGEVIGSVTYVPGPDTPMSEFDDPDAAGIRMLAVAVRRQGAGAGRALTDACIERARRDGRKRIVLHSTELMTVARAMYERSGFARAIERDAWFSDPPFSEDEPLHLIAYVLEL